MAPKLVFDDLTRLITVGSLKTKLAPTLSATDSLKMGAITRHLAPDGDREQRISLVRDGDRTIGWFGLFQEAAQFTGYLAPETLHAIYESKTIGECAESFSPTNFVSADTTALDAVFLFPSSLRHFFFVLEGNEITGTLNYFDFMKLPFRLCLFSLTLELEQLILDLALTNAEASWESLPLKRRNETIARTKYRRSDVGPELWLADTMLCDKGTIVKKMKLLPKLSGEQVKGLFDRVERVRNWAAHTGSNTFADPLRNAAAIRLFVHDVRRAIQQLRAELRRIGNQEA